VKADVMKWSDVTPGSTVLFQGQWMKFLRDRETQNPDTPEVRFIIVEFQGTEMECGVFNDYLVAVKEEEVKWSSPAYAGWVMTDRGWVREPAG
jgi:hypothetical protein